jgi:hypothetical protein
MPKTGWTGEQPDSGQPTAQQGFAGVLGSIRRDPGEGRTLEEIRQGIGVRGRQLDDRDPELVDNDERAANLMARGYNAGTVSRLASQLAETQTRLQDIAEKNEKARRRQARIASDHQAGKITAFDIARMDFDEPDPAAEAKLERRVASLQAQLRDAAAVVSPAQQWEPDAVEAASRRVQKVAAELARATAPERPPFDRPACKECADAGASRSESAAIHAEMRRIESGEPADAYRAQGAYDASDIVRGTEAAILGVR